MLRCVLALCSLFGVSRADVPHGLKLTDSAKTHKRFGAFEYIHPRPEAGLVSPLTTIALREGSSLQPGSIRGKLRVRGNKSGKAKGKLVLAADGKTVVFRSFQDFARGEMVRVKVREGIRTADGQKLGGMQWRFYLSDMNQTNETTKRKPSLSEEELTEAEKETTIREKNGVFTLDPPPLPGDIFYLQNNVSYLNLDDYHATFLRGGQFVNGFDFMDTLPVAKYMSMGYVTVPTKHFPKVRMSVEAKPGAERGYVFFTNRRTPKKVPVDEVKHPWLLVLDNDGDLVFYLETPERYGARGNFVLTSGGLLSFGSFLFDHKYHNIRRYASPHGYKKDGHDFKINEEENALMIHVDPQEARDAKGNRVFIRGATVTEQDKHGNVIFEWRMWDHLTVEQMLKYTVRNKDGDLAHPNTASWAADGNIIISFRHMGVIKVDRGTGDIMWRFGAHHGFSDFKYTNEHRPFTLQHDAQERETNRILMFDNHVESDEDFARAVEYELDHKGKTATKIWQYSANRSIYSLANGSTQRLANGNTVVCWGGMGVGPGFRNWAAPFYTEVKPNGEVVMEMYLEDGQNSHSAHKYTYDQWWGEPHWPPSLVLDSSNKDKMPRIHFSWNGATTVAKWLVYKDEAAPPKKLVMTLDRRHFEHRLDVPAAREECEYYQVVPVNGQGRRLKPSAVVKSYACGSPPTP